MVCLCDVNKTFNNGSTQKVLAVEGVSLSIDRGEVFGFIGPNGAGKSTTIKLLLDLIRPDSGSITINNIPSSNEKSRHGVGYLAENPYLYDYLTGLEYLMYAGSLSGMSKTVIKKRSEELLIKLRLDQAAGRKICGYSKGMQQRLAIAAAIIHEPDLIVLDEPMSGLDPLGRKLIFDLITELKQQTKTIFISSHVLTDIERLCDRVGIIVQGRLSFQGRLDQLESPLEQLFLQVVEQAGMGEVR